MASEAARVLTLLAGWAGCRAHAGDQRELLVVADLALVASSSDRQATALAAGRRALLAVVELNPAGMHAILPRRAGGDPRRLRHGERVVAP